MVRPVFKQNSQVLCRMKTCRACLQLSVEIFCRLREERDEKDSDYTDERYERERLEQERLEQEQMEWEHQQNQERLERQERYKNRRPVQSTRDDLPPQPPRHRRSNPSKRERNFTTSLTREEFDNASNMYPEDDEEISFKRSSSLRRPYASTENLSRRPVTRKHEVRIWNLVYDHWRGVVSRVLCDFSRSISLIVWHCTDGRGMV